MSNYTKNISLVERLKPIRSLGTIFLPVQFAARLLAWLLSRIMGASVGFRVAGWNCLRDVVVKFEKGAVESVSVGEIKLSLRQSLVKLGVGFISRDPKLQLVICDLEVVIRSSTKSVKKARSGSRSGKPRSSGRGKWMVVANMARFLSVSVTELVIKVPKATTEIKDLRLDISKDGGSKPNLFVKLHLQPLLVHMGESRLSYDQSSYFNQGGSISDGQASSDMVERGSAAFFCEEFSLSCEFGHDREVGVVIRDVDFTSGEVSVNLNEDMFLKNKPPLENFVKADTVGGDTSDIKAATKLEKKQKALLSLKKYTSVFPEKVSFNLPKLDVRFVHRAQNLVIDSNVTGIHLRSSKSLFNEDMGESTRFDVQLDFSEIHLLREGGSSILEILKLAVVSSFYVPIQPAAPLRAEVDVKLGGTQCNIIMSRLKPWMSLHLSKKKKMVLREESSTPERSQATEFNAIMWTCTVSAPEMSIVLYSISGSPLYHGCSQSSHVFANNIASTGTAVHMELGELHLHMADEYQECLKESLFGVETNTGSLMHIAKVSLDWGKKEAESHEERGSGRRKLILSVDVTGMGVYLSFQRVESLISTAMSFQALFKSLSAGKRKTPNRGAHSAKPSGKGVQLLKLNLEQCSINFCGDVGVEDAVVADPKRVNYGSQGGKVIIDVSADGTPRTASITSMMSNGSKNLKYSASLDIFHFSLSVNKEKNSVQTDLERARFIYQEYLDEQKPDKKVNLFDMQNAKFVRRSGGHNDVAVCSLFSATDISVRWEPDVHISLFELMLRLKLLIHNQKLQGYDNQIKEEFSSGKDVEPDKKANADPVHSDKQHKKRESVFAVDVEMLNIAAEVGDGVEAMVQVQSIFSENARIGVLLEGLMLSFNEARVFKSSRMQISRIPNISSSSFDAKIQAKTWDWVIQGLDVHICMPYRLQLRAIEDAIEDMMRGLKLITTAKTNLIFPKKESSKPKKPSSTKFGCVKFCIRKLTADIEEEPMQGWLDEHYQLMKNESCELAVRLKFLDDLVLEDVHCSGNDEPDESCSERKVHYNGVDIDLRDTSAVQKLREEIHKQVFQSYYQACKNRVSSEGSGAYKEGFQSGFKLSSSRASLLSVCATELDVTLTEIEGGDTGMLETLRTLDPICLENEIPFSRMYGRNIILNTGSLVVQIRNYLPILSASAGKCEGRVVLAQQATCFQPQMQQDVFIGRWRKVRMLRSVSGTTPPMKTYADLPLHFQKADIGYGVGFEPAFTDISYAFTVALRRANLSVRNPVTETPPPKKERSLPWWDEVRNYIHGKIGLYFAETRWDILGTTDPYEKLDKLHIVSGYMEIQQSDGRVSLSAKDFKVFLSSLVSLVNNCSLKLPDGVPGAFLEVPALSIDVTMEWECDSGNPLDHYLWALPVEGESRKIVYDPFRSTSLSLRWNISFRPSLPPSEKQSLSSTIAEQAVLDGAVYGSANKSEHLLIDSPTVNVGAHDLAWLIKFWNLNYLPPNKLRSFSRWPRFGVPRIPRSGNLSLDKVMTEFMLRIDAMPTCIKHMPLDDDDPARGLTFRMTRLKVELCYGRGRQKFTFDCRRDPLDLVYQGIDLHMLKAYINKEDSTCVAKEVQMTKKNSQSTSTDRVSNEKCNYMSGCTEKHQDDGFLLSSDYFTIRRQAPKADPAKLLAWQEAGRKNLEMTYVRSEFENGSESDEHTRSDPSDDDGFNVVIADNCQRVFVYGLKLLWTIENRDAVWSFAGGLAKAFQPPKPSPSRQYTQRKLLEENQVPNVAEMLQDDASKLSPSATQGSTHHSPQHVDTLGSHPSPSHSVKIESSASGAVAKNGNMDDSEEEGTRHFMVNVIQPQFNLHSEEANGRFLLAAASGRVLARSFHSVLHVGYEMIEQALGTETAHIPESQPEMTWKRGELSVMLEHVQAHVAPTDVDPGAGLQWLPKILRSSPKVKRTGALLERVFMPCTMYFRYTRHKGGTPELKVKPLKELTFNSPNITATMTSRQFQVMLDVLSNLLFARLPKPRKSSISSLGENDEDVEEEADEVVPDGVEEVELARISLEKTEQERKLLLDDIRKLSSCNTSGDLCTSTEKDDSLWMVSGGRSTLVQGLKKELGNTQKSRKAASAALRDALQKAAQLRLMEKEKNKSPSYAMRISLKINKVVWGMLADGKPFAEAEINNMIYDFDRDYKDVGIAQFTTKSIVVRNCLPNAKSDTLLAAWNPPPEWGKNVMLRVDARQGAPKDGNSALELFQVDIYPLKIHLTETMYRKMWEYLFPEEEQDSQRRQEVWKVSTTAGSKRVKKGGSVHEASASSSHSTKESDFLSKITASAAPLISSSGGQSSAHGDTSQSSKLQNLKANVVCGSTPELRRTSSFDRSWEENVAESVATELMLQVHSSSVSSSRSGPLGSTTEQLDESTRYKAKDSKSVKPGRPSHEEKKVGKAQDDKRTRPRKMMEFHNIKISQVELLVTYEGSRFAVSDLRLLMDTFHRVDFTGTWRRLFSRVKKHIIWGVLKSVTGMQGKKFKDKAHSHKEPTITGIPDTDLHFSDSDGDKSGKPDLPISFLKRPNDGAGDGFVTSIRGLFNSQRRKAKAFVLRTMRGDGDNDYQGDWSESDAEFSPFARQLTITKAKRLIRRHTKKFRSRGQKGGTSQLRDSLPESPRETSPVESDDSSGSYEDFHESPRPQ
ncbi:FMP27 [Macleaya cordata]|uniref:FMP27 n=1 Tax=Macleaya cordata TaxID=56857 RepID=A0A200PUD8_MACCD|nr:FMP27 [Macleaya cordata]